MTALDSKLETRSPLSPQRIAELTSLIRATGPEKRVTRSPLTDTAIAEIPESSIDDVESAFDAAGTAQKAWALTELSLRKQALLRYHDLILEHQSELLDLIQIESGKSRAHAFDEIAHLALTARYYARRLHKQLRPERRNGALPGLTSVQINHVPKGVVGVISPWNYPLTMAIADGLAAVAAGNAVVHKPDSQTPLVALAGVELLRRAGFPAEVWQVLSGAGSVIGTAIIERADYVCFTGSTATGTLIAKQCADRLIGCSLELGGKNPMIVLPGADLEKAAAGAVTACFASAGQLCVSVERLYVHENDYDAFRDAFVRRTQALSLGGGLDWEADIGSLISQNQLETVTKHIDDATSNGAFVLAGGRARPDIGPFFFEPTVLEGVTEAAECFAGETFGPLVSLYAYQDVDEALELANAGEYGLNASIWGDPDKARKLASQVRAGTVNINEGFGATFGSIDAPMGGMRKSGAGRRQGREGIHRFTEPQSVAVQRMLPMAGPAFLESDTYARLLTTGLKLLRRTPRA